MALSKAEILAAQDCPSKAIDVPEWGGQVLVKKLNAIELASLDYLRDEIKSVAQSVERSAKLVALCVVDELGNRLFGDDDVASLVAKHKDPLTKVFLEALRWNGLLSEDSTD